MLLHPGELIQDLLRIPLVQTIDLPLSERESRRKEYLFQVSRSHPVRFAGNLLEEHRFAQAGSYSLSKLGPSQYSPAQLQPFGKFWQADVYDPIKPRRTFQQRLVDLFRMVRGGDDQDALIVSESVQLVEKHAPVRILNESIQVLEGEDAWRKLPRPLEDLGYGIFLTPLLQVPHIKEWIIRQGRGGGLADHRLSRSGRADQEYPTPPGETEGFECGSG